MRATDFEYRHQTLLRMLVVGLALLTYVIEPDDIVWAAVRNHTTYRALLERLVFGTGAFLIVSSALFQTWASAYAGLDAASESQVLACDGPYRYVQHPLYLGRIFFALGIGLLAPALGTVILLTGEIVLILRLLGRDYVGQCIDHRHVRARTQLEVIVGLDVRPAHQVDAARIDHDQSRPFAQTPLKA